MGRGGVARRRSRPRCWRRLGLFLLPIRWHQLSRRWFVVVPAGVVVHDPVVLNDTLMMPSRTVASVSLDEQGAASQTAADLTGPTPGLGVEIVLVEPTTAVFAATPANPTGRAIHLTALVISPTRPGSVIRAARGYPSVTAALASVTAVVLRPPPRT